MQRKMNEDGLNIIRSFEGLEDGNPNTANLDPYLCPANVWTIGWGHAIIYKGQQLNKENDPFGSMAKKLYPTGITLEQADFMLKEDIYIRCKNLNNNILGNILLNENQFSAIVSFVYNVGEANFAKSTMLRKLKMGDYVGASNQFGKWVRANGVVLNGLIKRREAERKLFLKQ